MGRDNRNRNRNNRDVQKSSKVIRCTLHSKPVFEHEVCSSFSGQEHATIKNCEHCKNSM